MNRKELRKAKRIVVLCEGETEEIAVNHFIRRQWETDGLTSVGLHPINLRGHLDRIHHHTGLSLKNKKVVSVFTLVDLYEFKRFKLKPYKSLEDRIESAKEWLKKGLDKKIQERFHPHLSVYEVEAWILAEGNALAKKLKLKSIRPEKKAEEKNDQNPPKKRLNKLFHKNGKPEGYKEIRDSTPLFSKLNFKKVYTSCPYFKSFYDDLKSVAQSAL